MIAMPKAHPVVPLIEEELLLSLPAAEAMALLAERERVIWRMEHDPLRHGHRPGVWEMADAALEEFDELLVLGGNRASKSEWCAERSVRTLREKGDAEVACLHSSAAMSIAQQQSRVYKFLPPEWREAGKGAKGDRTTHVMYTRANGFTNGKFILPEGQTCYFFNYGQDVKVMEGPEYDLVWGDELIPLAFVEALRYRLVTRRGKLIVSFTPIMGYTPVVADFVAGYVVAKWERAELLPQDRVLVKGCPPGCMPRVLRSGKGNRGIVCFWTQDNVFSDYGRMVSTLQGQPVAKVMIRGYGWATKLAAASLGNFEDRAHVISRKRFEELAAAGGTRYVSCDPAGAKPWVVKWYLVTREGEVIVYREWPTQQEFGPWAKTGAKDGETARFLYDEGCTTAPRPGMNGYKKLIWELEGAFWDGEKRAWDRSKQEDILMRFMDPRFGGKVAPGAEEGTSIIELLGQEELGKDGVLYEAMDWERAPASGVEETAQMINTLMEWNAEEPVSVLNSPKWFVVEDCLNSIFAYKEWSIAGGEKCALKDWVDPDRYFVKADWGFVGEMDLRASGGGAW